MKQKANHYALAFTIVMLCVAVAITATPTAAYAQAVGGGGGNFLTGLLNWISGNVITTVGSLAIIGLGGAMMFHHFHLYMILAIAAAVWVMFNYQTVLSMLTGG